MITDIHMHLIPGVDDGSDSIDMSLDMIKMAYNQGVRIIFCTSHDSAYDWDQVTPRENFEKLKIACAQAFPDVKLFLGCEIYCIPGYMKALVKGINDGRYPTMNNSEYILVEFPTGRFTFEEMFSCIRALQDNRNKVIIAHVERYNSFLDLEKIKQLKMMGCLIQVNAFSLAEETSEALKSLANQVVENELADFIGTDAHKSYRRAPVLESGVEIIRQKARKEYAEKLLCGNSEEILKGY